MMRFSQLYAVTTCTKPARAKYKNRKCPVRYRHLAQIQGHDIQNVAHIAARLRSWGRRDAPLFFGGEVLVTFSPFSRIMFINNPHEKTSHHFRHADDADETDVRRFFTLSAQIR